VEQQIEIRPIDASKIVVETAEFMSMFDEQCRVDHHIHNSSSPEKTRVLDAESMKAFRRVKDENKKSVDLMCRRFEVRRSARNFAKTTSQKSGRISPRLLKNYRFSEDIFDRMTVRSDEKNHGIVILLDWSGSMQGIIRESVSQLVATVEFCRRVGIPVQVYFFSSIYNKAVLDEVVRRNPSVNRKEMLANVAMGYIPATGKVWSEEICNNIFNEIVCGTTPQDIMEGKASHCSMFSLFKVYDSAAGQRKMVASLGRLILLSDAVGKFSRSRRVTIDHGPLSLGGTPLDESILAMRDIVNDFRKSSNTKVTLISITDGEGQSLINRVHSPYVGSKTLSRVIVDKETGRRFDLKDFNSTTHSAVVQMFKDATGARIVGIRLESREGSNYRLSYSTPWWWQEGSWDCADAEKNKREAAEKKYAKDKFLSLEIPVYDGYCLVAIVEDSQAEKMAEKAEAKGLAAKTIQTRQKNLEKSFMAAMRQKQANRLFINTLMDVVAK
jgi:Mg-chelatase subunit ChlD